MLRDSSAFIAAFFFSDMGCYSILFYFEWKQIISELHYFNVEKYLCESPRENHVSTGFSCKKALRETAKSCF